MRQLLKILLWGLLGSSAVVVATVAYVFVAARYFDSCGISESQAGVARLLGRSWATLGVTQIMKIRKYEPQDEQAVVALWQECGLTRPWNDPRRDIARKLTVQPELFLVGTFEGAVISTAMVGFDGHRGWVYYLAVAPKYRGKSFGRMLMQEAERLLIERGCPKLNLQVRSSNPEAVEFYRSLGYTQDEVVSLGRRLIPDGAAQL